MIKIDSNLSEQFYEESWTSTIEEVKIPEDNEIIKIKTVASTNIGNYVVKTLCKADDWYETFIISNSHLDDLHIGYYLKKSTTRKSALDSHIEAIWHIHHSCREGI